MGMYQIDNTPTKGQKTAEGINTAHDTCVII